MNKLVKFLTLVFVMTTIVVLSILSVSAIEPAEAFKLIDNTETTMHNSKIAGSSINVLKYEIENADVDNAIKARIFEKLNAELPSIYALENKSFFRTSETIIHSIPQFYTPNNKDANKKFVDDINSYIELVNTKRGLDNTISENSDKINDFIDEYGVSHIEYKYLFKLEKMGFVDVDTSDLIDFSTGSGELSEKMLWPLSANEDSYITSPYGGRYLEGTYKFHHGLDMGCKDSYECDKPIVAAADGIVIWVQRNANGYGNYCVIDHGNGVATLYAHCYSINVSIGDKVTQGEEIAIVGNTGHSLGHHCHFEVRINGDYANPANYINNISNYEQDEY